MFRWIFVSPASYFFRHLLCENVVHVRIEQHPDPFVWVRPEVFFGPLPSMKAKDSEDCVCIPLLGALPGHWRLARLAVQTKRKSSGASTKLNEQGNLLPITHRIFPRFLRSSG